MNPADQSPTDAAIPTPRTDANSRDWDRTNRAGCDADFARQLERELYNALRDNETFREAQKACEDCMTPTYAELRTQLATLNKELEEARERADGLLSDNAKRCVELDALCGDLERVITDRDTLRAQLAQAEANVASLQAALTDAMRHNAKSTPGAGERTT